MFEEYFKLQDEYEKKYGDKTVVLMQVGAHYEIFEYRPDIDQYKKNTTWKNKIGKATEMSPILNYVRTSKSGKDPHSITNPYMVGFPISAYTKCKDQILHHDYTIVKIDQVGGIDISQNETIINTSVKLNEKSGGNSNGKLNGNLNGNLNRNSNGKSSVKLNGKSSVKLNGKSNKKDFIREVTEIVSPATDIDFNSNQNEILHTNQIVSIYIEAQKYCYRLEDVPIVCGISSFDVKTGKNIVTETYSLEENPLEGIHEIYRFLLSQSPREVLVTLTFYKNKNKEFERKYKDFIFATLELEKYPILIFKDYIFDYQKIEYQKQFLTKAFHSQPQYRIKNINSPGANDPITFYSRISNSIIEELGLERMPNGTISYIYLLQYCYEHNETILSKLQHPETSWSEKEKHLILTHNAIRQIEILPLENRRGGYDSLFSVLDNTSTPMGKRFLRSRILNPITDPIVLNLYYDITDELISNSKSDPSNEKLTVKKLESLLSEIPDIEKIQRKLLLKVIRPHELSILFTTYIKIVNIYTEIVNSGSQNLSSLFLSQEEIESFNQILSIFFSQVDPDKLSNFTILNSKGKTASSIKPFYLQEGLKIDYEGNHSFFLPEVNPDFDQLITSMDNSLTILEKICDHLNTFLSKTIGKKLVCDFSSDRKKKKSGAKDEIESLSSESMSSEYLSDSYDLQNSQDSFNLDNSAPLDKLSSFNLGFLTTPSKAKILKSSPIDSHLCGKIEIKTISGLTIVTSSVIENHSNFYRTTQHKYREQLLFKYFDFIDILSSGNFYSGIVRFVSQIDFIKTNAHNAIKYNYYKPTILDSGENDGENVAGDSGENDCNNDGSDSGENVGADNVGGDNDGENNIEKRMKEKDTSFLRITGVRHPLVERLIPTQYISNDIVIGSEPQGLLIYGVNSAGKTTLIKAVGLNIIMAQSGMFTAGKLEYRPYTQILTRLTGDDDILHGKSSFVVEMSEVRTITRNCNSRSLILCDELSKGTESLSATGISVASIERLIERKSSFIISTHMHQIVKVPRIEKLSSKILRICHLATTFDKETGELIYDRHLNDGPGSSIYGLEVAKSLFFDKDFLEIANQVRKELNEIDPLMVPTKKSKYNAKIYIDECTICRKKTDLHTHHIYEQKDADQNGYIETNVKTNLNPKQIPIVKSNFFHKNESANLLVLCRDCHTKIHSMSKQISIKQTPKGNVIQLI